MSSGVEHAHLRASPLSLCHPSCPSPPLCAVEDHRAKERFAEQVPTSALTVGVGGWKWSEATPRPRWEQLKEAKVWKDPAYAGLRDGLSRPAPLPTVIQTVNEALYRCMDIDFVGEAPMEDSDREREEAELQATQATQQPPAVAAAQERPRAKRPKSRKRARSSDPDEAPPMHRQRVFLYKAGEEVPADADTSPVGLLLVHAPPAATVRLPAQMIRLLDSTPIAVYGSPANVSVVVEDVRRVVGDRDRVEVDVFVRPEAVVTGVRLVKRALVLVTKPEWIVRSKVSVPSPSPAFPLPLPVCGLRRRGTRAPARVWA
jgi:hypothetical protein